MGKSEVREIFKEIDEDYIKKALPKYHERILAVHNRMIELYDHLDIADELIKEVAYKSINYDRIGVGSGVNSDLTNVMIKHENLAKDRSKDVRAEMWRLIEEEETLDRIWCSYKAISGDGFDYITKLYVEGKPYKETEKESRTSHKTFEKRRSRAMKDIMTLYNSHYNNSEIIAIGDRRIQNKKRSEEKSYEQFNMEFK